MKKIWHSITYNSWYAIKPNQTKSIISWNFKLVNNWSIHSVQRKTIVYGLSCELLHINAEPSKFLFLKNWKLNFNFSKVWIWGFGFFPCKKCIKFRYPNVIALTRRIVRYPNASQEIFVFTPTYACKALYETSSSGEERKCQYLSCILRYYIKWII